MSPSKKDSLTGGNFVKSEAPDAITKTTKGYALPSFDDRLTQSPVNIITDSTEKDTHHSITFKFNTGITAVENLGHTIQVDFKAGSTTLADDRVYFSKQFHFHTPSEHLIDGITYPMEMHIVNILKDSSDGSNPHFW